MAAAVANAAAAVANAAAADRSSGLMREVHEDRSSWRFAELPREVRGLTLCDPEVARHSCFVLSANFLSDDEIDIVNEAAAGNAKFSTPLYLQHQGLPRALEPIFVRICAHLTGVDAEHWGVLADLGKTIGHGVNCRVVEYHEYSTRGRKQCDSHYDAGSLFTVDIMLSDTSKFEGGEMRSTTWADRYPVGTGAALNQGGGRCHRVLG